MKKSLSIFLFFTLNLLYFPQNTFSSWDDFCGEQTWYELHSCRVENICEQYKSEKPTYSTENYESAEGQTPKFHGQQSNAAAFDNAKEIYRENIGNIYKCAMIQAQKNSLTFLEKQIKLESSWELDDTIWGQIDLRINRLELSANTIGCSLTDKQRVLNKLNLLRETTYEACKYINYLEYLKSFYATTENNLPSDPNAVGTMVLGELPNKIDGTQQAIAQEISHTYKVFPIAYHAYSEYENNFPIHFLLEIIAWDFLLLRQALYESLMPIAQFGLKVINAMSY